MPLVGHDHQGFEPTKGSVGPPLLGQFDRGPGHVVRVILQLRLEPFEQGEAVGRTPGESGKHPTVEQAPDLRRVSLHDLITEGHLAVTTEGDPIASSDG